MDGEAMSEGFDTVLSVLGSEILQLLESEVGHIDLDIHHHLAVGVDDDNRHHKDAAQKKEVIE